MEQPTPKRLLDRVRNALRLKHHSYRTKQAYVGWNTRYVLFHGRRHPDEMGGKRKQDRVTILPDSLIPKFQKHLLRVRRLHDRP